MTPEQDLATSTQLVERQHQDLIARACMYIDAGLVTVDAVCKALKISKSTWYRWAADNRDRIGPDLSIAPGFLRDESAH